MSFCQDCESNYDEEECPFCARFDAVVDRPKLDGFGDLQQEAKRVNSGHSAYPDGSQEMPVNVRGED